VSKRQVVDSKPSLRTLAYVLRNRELWPAGFEWDYRACGTCALGVANRLWGITNTSDELEAYFGLSVREAEHIFINDALLGRRVLGGDVTPAQVADLIDAHLAAAQ